MQNIHTKSDTHHIQKSIGKQQNLFDQKKKKEKKKKHFGSKDKKPPKNN